MILHAIELTHVGRFRETVRIGPFSAGLNVIAEPNESGKSTTLRGAARALFDRHTSKSEEIKELRPAGTELSPRIAVEFETVAGRFRIEKTFLKSPTSFLKHWRSERWELIADGDAADKLVHDHLKSTLPARSVSTPEHWGLLSFLWARQDELAEWPTFENSETDQRIRSCLARVEIDPVIEKLRAKLESMADSVITSKGQPKAGGPLAQAESELTAIEDALRDIRQTHSELDAAQQLHQQAEGTVAQLEAEHARRETAAALLRDQASATERLRGELAIRQQALDTAREKLGSITSDEIALAQDQTAIASATQELSRLEQSSTTAVQTRDQLRLNLDQFSTERETLEAKVQQLRGENQRIQTLLKLRQQTAAADTLARQLELASKAAAELATLDEKKAGLPAITPAKVRRIEELTEEIRTHRAQVQALGLTLDLIPEKPSSVTVKEAGQSKSLEIPGSQTTRLNSAQSLDLELSGWGRVIVRSGGQEAQQAASALTKAEAALRASLEEVGVADLPAIRDAVAARRELDQQLKAATSSLAALLGEHPTLASLRESWASTARRAETLARSVQATNEEQALTQADLEAIETRCGSAVPALEKALKEFDARVEKVRAQERTSANQVQETARLSHDQRTKLKTLEARFTALTSRYPEGLESAKKTAQIAFGQAEARVATTEAELPSDFERLPDRNRRAAAALQEVGNELIVQRSRRDQAKGTLESLGGKGLYSRETELEENKAEVLLRREAALSLAWSTRITHDLISHRKQAATRAVLSPLEDRLTGAFADLSGDATRRIFLNEDLQVIGLGRTREELYPFELLSQGAKEQLLLCLRIAVAQELAQEEPQVLILDDVLVNTDSVRQERIFDVLENLSSKLQIILLTCHEDRYRGVGKRILLRG